jgi:hypothetical protein
MRPNVGRERRESVRAGAELRPVFSTPVEVSEPRRTCRYAASQSASRRSVPSSLLRPVDLPTLDICVTFFCRTTGSGPHVPSTNKRPGLRFLVSYSPTASPTPQIEVSMNQLEIAPDPHGSVTLMRLPSLQIQCSAAGIATAKTADVTEKISESNFDRREAESERTSDNVDAHTTPSDQKVRRSRLPARVGDASGTEFLLP